MAGHKRQWLVDSTAYTLAGGMASALVGALLGWLGAVLLPGQIGGLGLLAAIAVAALALARELGWLAVPLPQFRRQTRDVWGKVFPRTLAAAFWGIDVGLVFTTWLTFSGMWLLLVVVILVGEPGFGAALFVVHWFGRALSVWTAPWLLRDARAIPGLVDWIAGQRRLFQRLHALGLTWAIIVLISWFAHGASISN
ncbi:MAG: hypothetical protein ACRDJH_10835 [Thermomicrobiales bacterium]